MGVLFVWGIIVFGGFGVGAASEPEPWAVFVDCLLMYLLVLLFMGASTMFWTYFLERKWLYNHTNLTEAFFNGFAGLGMFFTPLIMPIIWSIAASSNCPSGVIGNCLFKVGTAAHQCITNI